MSLYFNGPEQPMTPVNRSIDFPSKGISFHVCMLLHNTCYETRLPMTYRGVFVSLNPRKIPCMAKDRSTAGAPSDLNFKYFSAGFSIGELYRTKKERRKNKIQLVINLYPCIFKKEKVPKKCGRHLQISHPSRPREVWPQR